ncbi:DUF6262 family protein [Saccharopolyspora hattusasensis]|uniref:DUF6262 family protein n=1 Tax=Saccharopolyspora hattusasensis TaxID=1128679 RepID=UPI003D96BE66
MSNRRTERIAVLTSAAKAKSQAKTAAAEQAIRDLIKRGEPITFQAVARAADVSHAFLYNHPQLRSRIEHLRARHRPQPQPSDTSDTDNNLLLALTTQIERLKKQHRAEVQALRDALEQAHGKTSTCAASSPDEAGNPPTIYQSQQQPDLRRHRNLKIEPQITSGVGKTHLATALRHIAVRRRHSVLMLRADALFKRLKAARLDNSVEVEMRRLAQVQLLLIDDFALQPLEATETADFYELVVARHHTASTVLTSNREPAEWLAMMSDPLLAQSAGGRLTFGRTETAVVRWRRRFVHVPMPLIISYRNQVDPDGDLWMSVFEATGHLLPPRTHGTHGRLNREQSHRGHRGACRPAADWDNAVAVQSGAGQLDIDLPDIDSARSFP